MIKLSKGKVWALVAATLPMAAIGATGGVATYVNMDRILHSTASAAGLVAAGEGATLIAALVALAVTLMGQHTPAVVRMGMWLVPLLAAATGVALARNLTERVMMAVTPLAMTAAGEGIAFVARRMVAYQTDIDLEQQRRSGLMLWHANRAANGSRLGRTLSKWAVWRLAKHFAATDGQMSVQLDEIQRYRIADKADENLAAVFGGAAERPSVAPAPPVPALPPMSRPQAVSAPRTASVTARIPDPVETADVAVDDEGDDWIQSVFAEAAERDTVTAPVVRLLTSDDVAELLNAKPATVRSWVRRGRLRVHGQDDKGRNLFHPDDVEKLGETNRVEH